MIRAAGFRLSLGFGDGSVMRRRPSLDAALGEVERGTMRDISRIVVSQLWWFALTEAERGTFELRCASAGIELLAAHRVSRHFVEVVSGVAMIPLDPATDA